MEIIQITQSALAHLKSTVGTLAPESGGFFLGSRTDGIIREFLFDRTGSTSATTYSPDTQTLNPIFKEKWEQEGLEVIGSTHSHPVGARYLSGGDQKYLKVLHECLNCDRLITAIVFSEAQTPFTIVPYVTYTGAVAQYQEATLQVIPDELLPPMPLPEKEVEAKTVLPDFSRLEGSVDLDVMRQSKVVVVGTGGANQLVEDLVRSGVEEIVLIDFDSVEAANIPRQGFVLDDIGKPKVEVLGQKLQGINPRARIRLYQEDVTLFTDSVLESVFGDAALALFMTDSFKAQAFGNTQAIRFKFPAIWGGLYERGCAGEIIYTIPGYTEACYRCITSARYQGNLNEEVKVPSQASTVLHAHLLDAYIGFLALAILHRDAEKSVEFAGWFTKPWKQNLLQVRMHPDYSTGEGALFARKYWSIRDFMFEPVWQMVEAEKPPKYHHCPDCQGMGYEIQSDQFVCTE